MEGFYHFAPPCADYPNLKPPNCTVGSPWSSIAQGIMGPIGSANLIARDEFHKIFKLPEHFPSINNKCNFKSKCVLNVSTTTSNEYSSSDDFDNGIIGLCFQFFFFFTIPIIIMTTLLMFDYLGKRNDAGGSTRGQNKNDEPSINTASI
jgi:hypothetical protein